MKQVLKFSMYAATLLAASCAHAAVPYLSFRSQGINGAREMVGWQTQINKYDMCRFYGSFSVTPEYTRSFWDCRLAEALFGQALVGSMLPSSATPSVSNNLGFGCCNSGCNNGCNSGCNNGCGRGSGWGLGGGCGDCCDRSVISVQGSKVANRNPNALLADDFYLPTDFSSNVSFRPRIQNFIVDFNLFLGFDEWCEGLFFRVHMPVCWTKWQLNMCENIQAAGQNPADPGYYNDTIETATDGSGNLVGLQRDFLLNSFEQFASGQGSIQNVSGITYEPLRFARMVNCPDTRTRPAEITAALGWNFLMDENYYWGFSLRAAAPTGNRPEGCLLFEPIVGQGHHWELGAGMDSHYRFWCSEDETRDFSMYLDACVTHLFKAHQRRTFDLKGANKELSRYALAGQFNVDTTSFNNLTAGDTAADASQPSAQFNSVFAPVANFSTIPVSVSAAVQGEIIFKLAYTHCNFQWDIGYNFWGRSCERICPRCVNDANSSWFGKSGLKGDAFAYGFTATKNPNGNLVVDVSQTGIPLSATESASTIYNGTNNYPDGLNDLAWNQNPGVDNPALAWNGSSPASPLATYNSDSSAWLQVNTSKDPVLLGLADLDLEGASTRGISNKVFTHFNYTWNDCECWVPYLGIGGEAEFGQRFCNNNSNGCCSRVDVVVDGQTPQVLSCSKGCDNDCNSCCGNNDRNNCCKSIALSQWGVWVKGGVSFN